MTLVNRRGLMTGLAATAAYPSIARAVSIRPRIERGTLEDVQHIVVLTQENRSFDHYFGSMTGVRGFSDPHPAPTMGPEGTVGDVLLQKYERDGRTQWLRPFPLRTDETFSHMRVRGTPHSWPDAQAAWDLGRMGDWPNAKNPHSLAYYERGDLPFQYALADAFTLCDGYFCSLQTGTNPNRVMLWTGTNDPAGRFGGPCIGNSNDTFPGPSEDRAPYRWTTYVERLQEAGIDWRIYQDMDDNFSDNPLVGFKRFQDARTDPSALSRALMDRGLSTRALDGLRQDVVSGRLPQVSYVIAPAAASEHPGPSSPAQGAVFTAEVIDALTADPESWARTVLLLNFDENDGFFDHVPPPAPPSRDADGRLRGESLVSLSGEYHDQPSPSDQHLDLDAYRHRPYGLGPRVPLYAVSPWSRGGFVCSEVFDHTSVIRFMERRFGVREPNISPWRRAVCGDLTSCFDFTGRDVRRLALPDVRNAAARAASVKPTVLPPLQTGVEPPQQAKGHRPARPTPYSLSAELVRDDGGRLKVRLRNHAHRTAVLHVYDRLRLEDPPYRFTILGRRDVEYAVEQAGDYDIQVMGPDGFHRRYKGRGKTTAWSTSLALPAGGPLIEMRGEGSVTLTTPGLEQAYEVKGATTVAVRWLDDNRRYDIVLGDGETRIEFAGRAPNQSRARPGATSASPGRRRLVRG